jgi:hypothetical protein
MEPKSLQQDILYFAKRGFLTRFNRRVRLRQSSDRPRYRRRIARVVPEGISGRWAPVGRRRAVLGRTTSAATFR